MTEAAAVIPGRAVFDTALDGIAGALERDGYAIADAQLPGGLLQALLDHFTAMEATTFSRAGIGREADFQVNPFIRTDAIHWLDGTCAATAAWFDWMERFREGLNRRLFLGLFDYECHYAWYDTGAFYKTHVDTFRGTDTRVISTVLYLNPDWTPGDGGELVIYRPDQGGILETIAPLYGRMVLFLSAEFPHEVLPVNAPRYSLAGWFRKNSVPGVVTDPCR